jgi:hypothetical protein
MKLNKHTWCSCETQMSPRVANSTDNHPYVVFNKSTPNGTKYARENLRYLHHDLYTLTLDSTCTGHHIIATYFL